MSNPKSNFLSVITAGTMLASLLSSCNKTAVAKTDQVKEDFVLAGELVNQLDLGSNGVNNSVRLCVISATTTAGRKCLLEFDSNSPDTFPQPGSYVKVKYSANDAGSKAGRNVIDYVEVTEAEFKAVQAQKSASKSEWAR